MAENLPLSLSSPCLSHTSASRLASPGWAHYLAVKNQRARESTLPVYMGVTRNDTHSAAHTHKVASLDPATPPPPPSPPPSSSLKKRKGIREKSSCVPTIRWSASRRRIRRTRRRRGGGRKERWKEGGKEGKERKGGKRVDTVRKRRLSGEEMQQSSTPSGRVPRAPRRTAPAVHVSKHHLAPALALIGVGSPRRPRPSPPKKSLLRKHPNDPDTRRLHSVANTNTSASRV